MRYTDIYFFSTIIVNLTMIIIHAFFQRLPLIMEPQFTLMYMVLPLVIIKVLFPKWKFTIWLEKERF